jgi:hypothetical protein
VHPGGQLRERERLCEVVIGTEHEPSHSIAHLTGSREHENAHVRLVLDQFSAHVVPVHRRNVPIQNHHVIVIDGRALESCCTVVDHIDGVCIVA